MSLSCEHLYPEPKCAICICWLERLRRLNLIDKAVTQAKSRMVRLGQTTNFYADFATIEKRVMAMQAGDIQRQVGMSAALGMGYGVKKRKCSCDILGDYGHTIGCGNANSKDNF